MEQDNNNGLEETKGIKVGEKPSLQCLFFHRWLIVKDIKGGAEFL